MTSFDSLLTQTPNVGGVSEQDFRLNILNALLQTPHKNFEPYIPLFAHVAKTDPLFFGHLAAWYSKNGTVRDLQQLFVAFLSTSTFGAEHREAGLAMLMNLPPFQVENVLGILKGKKRSGKFVKGVANTVPRSFRTAVKDYLRKRESDRDFFDATALTARRSLRTLYGSLRIKPNDYAQAILFDNKPPEGSRVAALKKIAESNDVVEQARLVVENKIPFRVAVTIMKDMSAPSLAALINAMSPQDVINALNMLKQRGATDNPELRKLIDAKLKQAKTDKRVSALKTREALKNSDVDAELAALVTEVGDRRMTSGQKIKKKTALLIDKSGSLDQAIEVGIQLAAVIAPNCVGGLDVLAFDTMVYPIKSKGNNLSDWEAAFKGIIAQGGTACGAPIAKLIRDGNVVEQIIMVTDQGENDRPYFTPELQKYSKQFGVEPNVILLNVGNASATLEKQLKAANIEVDTFTFKGDYYSLPTIIPMLAGGSRLDLLAEIMDFPLPKREEAKEPVAV